MLDGVSEHAMTFYFLDNVRNSYFLNRFISVRFLLSETTTW